MEDAARTFIGVIEVQAHIAVLQTKKTLPLLCVAFPATTVSAPSRPMSFFSVLKESTPPEALCTFIMNGGLSCDYHTCGTSISISIIQKERRL
jgi:hypothetical protein